MTEYILKHNKKKERELKYDFMPPILEIIERPAHKAGTIIILGVFTLLVTAIIWACLSEIDVVITASGSIQPKGNLNVVKTYSAGTVETINVNEGSYVEKGDILFKLNTESLDIDVTQLNSQKKALETQKEIYNMIKNGEDMSDIDVSGYDEGLQSKVQLIIDTDTSFKNELKKLKSEKKNNNLNKKIIQLEADDSYEDGIQRQAQTIELKVQQYDIAAEQLELQIIDAKTQYSAQINSKLSEIDSLLDKIDEDQSNPQKNILETQKDIYNRIKNGEDISTIDISGYDEGLQSEIQSIIDVDTSFKNNIENLEKEKINNDLNKQITQLQTDDSEENKNQKQAQAIELKVQQYDLANEQLELQISDTKTQYSAQINSKLSEIDAKLDEIDVNLEKYRLSKEYQQITAPVNGYVNTVNVNTVGDTVTSAQEMVTIVPADAKLEMVCYVQNMDISDVKVGMETEIKLESYPYNKYGTVKGTVSYISPSSFISEQLGSVYLVKIQITDKHEDIEIISGLSGSVEIKTDKRTVMDYFLEPIMKGFGNSLKEK